MILQHQKMGIVVWIWYQEIGFFSCYKNVLESYLYNTLTGKLGGLFHDYGKGIFHRTPSVVREV